MLSDYNYNTKVMGCNFHLTFVAQNVRDADLYFTQAWEIAQAYESRFSRFREDSELSLLNKQKTMTVSDEFLNIYRIAFQLYKKTKGGFNPLVQVRRIGYNNPFEEIEKTKNIRFKNLRYDVNMENSMVSGNMFFLGQNQELDFGGLLKGYVAEQIAKRSASKYGMIINIGGDIYVRGKNTKNKNFCFFIHNPLDKDKKISFPLEDASLCTSGTYKRKWKCIDGDVHHIIDSRSRISVQSDVVSASVIHKDGAVADAFATYAIVLGMERALDFLQSEGIDFVLIDKHGKVKQSNGFKKIKV